MSFIKEEIERIITDAIFELTLKRIRFPEEELIKSGVLTSITVAELAVTLEKVFSISFLFIEIKPENFKNLVTITKLVQAKL
jgi:acyl carrier protein